MLEDYKQGQTIFYNLITNSILNNRISHAYLFETNNNDDYMDIVMAFVKAVVCPYNYFNNEKCNNCVICKRIDENNYPEIKIINPDGLWIKKDQLLDLQTEFNKKNIEGNKRIYIINECEKLNKQAANSILKFLEEPEDNIIAILVTNNINMVLETIKSRCQMISLNKNNNKKFDRKNIMNVLEFIKVLETNKKDTIIYEKELWLKKFKDRSDNINAFDIMINFYNDVILYKLGQPLLYFDEYIEDIKNIDSDFYQISRKLEILIENKDFIKYNLNINLLLDKVIIDFGG